MSESIVKKLDNILVNQGSIMQKLNELEMPVPPTGSARFNKEFMEQLASIKVELKEINKKLEQR